MIRKSTERYRMFATMAAIAAAAIGLGLAAALCTPALAQEQNGGAPGDWLSTYASARSIGMGGAFVAAGYEPLGALWNPACLSQVFQNQVHLETARLFEATSINTFGFASPERRVLPGFGLSVVSMRSGDFERTNELNDVLGTFHDGETAFLVSASKSIAPRLSLGAGVRIVRQSIDEFQASGVGMDVGVLASVTPSVVVGASFINIGGPSLTLRETAEDYPTELRGGLAVKLLSGRALITTEIDNSFGYGARLRAGSEFWVHPMLGLRVGYDDSYLSGGMSCVVAPGMRLDYGISNQTLGVTHRIGISYSFGGFFASSDATPSVFSPLGTESVTKFGLTAHTKADAANWSLDIVDKSDQTVRRFSGKGSPPPHIVWDGKDEAGMSLADGIYRYRLVVVDVDGRTTAAREHSVEITTSGPQGEVPIVVGGGQ
jgi:hypothetical protein